MVYFKHTGYLHPFDTKNYKQSWEKCSPPPSNRVCARFAYACGNRTPKKYATKNSKQQLPQPCNIEIIQYGAALSVEASVSAASAAVGWLQHRVAATARLLANRRKIRLRRAF